MYDHRRERREEHEHDRAGDGVALDDRVGDGDDRARGAMERLDRRDDDQVGRGKTRQIEQARERPEFDRQNLQRDDGRGGGPDVDVLEQTCRRRLDARPAIERVPDLHGDECRERERPCVASRAVRLQGPGIRGQRDGGEHHALPADEDQER